jgi:cytochrome c oxidase subunit 3
VITKEAKKNQHTLAMTVALISWGMLFATLFMGYAVYRSSTNVWPPMGFTRISLVIPTLSTLIILVSSFFCYRMKNDLIELKYVQSKLNLNMTIVLAVAFLMSQVFLWKGMNATGIYVSSGIYASIMHALTWIHAAHVIVAVAFLIYLRWQFAKNVNTPERLQHTTLNVEKFWHFLGIIWFLMYFILFVF